MPEDKAFEAWNKIWESSLSQTKSWASTNLKITPDQFFILQKTPTNTTNYLVYWQNFLSHFKEEQKQTLSKNFSAILAAKITSFLESAKSQATYEEKQVLNSYLNTAK